MNEKEVRGSFGTTEIHGYSNEIIEISLDFEEPVLITSSSKTAFEFTKLSGDDLYDFDYSIVGIGDSDKKYRIHIIVPEGRQGKFKLELKDNIYDPKTSQKSITGIVEPIIVEYKTSSVHERVERLEKLVLLLLQLRSSGNYHNKSVESMISDTFPASLEWMSKLLSQFESGEEAIEQICVILQERLDLIKEV